MKPFKKSKLFSFCEDLTPEVVELGLKKLPLVPTTPTNRHTHGFVNVDHVFSNDGQFLKKMYDMHLAVMCFEKRTPSNVAISILADKNKRELIAQGEKITQKIMRKLRKEATDELAKKVDPQREHVNIAFDFNTKRVILDTHNQKELDKILDMLSKVGVNLKLESLHFDIQGFLEQIIDKPSEVLSDAFDVGTSVQMRDNSKQKSTVSYRNQDIINQEIETNREKSKSPVAVGLQYKDSLEFTLHDTHGLSGMKAHNPDNSYFVKLLEKIKGEEFGDETVTDFFQRVGIMLVSVSDVYADLLAMTNSADELKQYMITD
ncbi:recombination-associated protein RdgC [Vibrio parahaemolyticus]|uniref:recombination-associated protein RdgC n=1 Tax=Vibrio parahaemolyticus TaxID=670 RepID=UPI000813328A|nr:recombination-associated protein RdgC [Vibrio parahaemolyticus]OCP68413.1 hypothetical protein AKH08_16515 [Vibrio parahaemolyticus]